MQQEADAPGSDTRVFTKEGFDTGQSLTGRSGRFLDHLLLMRSLFLMGGLLLVRRLFLPVRFGFTTLGRTRGRASSRLQVDLIARLKGVGAGDFDFAGVGQGDEGHEQGEEVQKFHFE